MDFPGQRVMLRGGGAMADFPTTAEAITPAFLASIGIAGVDRVLAEPIGAGMVGDSVRLTLIPAASAPGPGENLPGPAPNLPGLVAKLPATDLLSRQSGKTLFLYGREAAFYRSIAATVDTRKPLARFVGYDTENDRFLLLLEDLGPARAGDQLTGCSAADAAHVIRQAAALHAPRWGDATIAEMAEIRGASAVTPHIRAYLPTAFAAFETLYADDLGPDLMAVARGFMDRLDAYFAFEPTRKSVVHGDLRLDNILFDILGGAEPCAILDWQTWTYGNPLTDIGYFLGAGIQPTLRQQVGDDLLALYKSELATRGIDYGPGFDRDLAHGVLHGILLPIIASASVGATERGKSMFFNMAQGACIFAHDLDALAILR